MKAVSYKENTCRSFQKVTWNLWRSTKILRHFHYRFEWTSVTSWIWSRNRRTEAPVTVILFAEILTMRPKLKKKLLRIWKRKQQKQLLLYFKTGMTSEQQKSSSHIQKSHFKWQSNIAVFVPTMCRTGSTPLLTVHPPVLSSAGGPGQRRKKKVHRRLVVFSRRRRKTTRSCRWSGRIDPTRTDPSGPSRAEDSLPSPEGAEPQGGGLNVNQQLGHEAATSNIQLIWCTRRKLVNQLVNQPMSNNS